MTNRLAIAIALLLVALGGPARAFTPPRHDVARELQPTPPPR